MATAESDVLLRAIDNASPGILREILRSMCRESAEFRKQAEMHLLVAKPQLKRKIEVVDLSSDAEDGDDDEEVEEEEEAGTTDPPISRYEVCDTCEETFDVTENHEAACKTHPSELYVDSDVFPDDDDIQYRPDSIDPYTDWRRDEWPEGFIYACCEKNCKDPGCVVGRHISIRRRQTLPAGNCGDRRKP